MYRDILEYNQATGELLWKPRTPDMFSDKGAVPAEALCRSWNSRCAGKPACNTVMNRGYKCGSINGKMRLAHRVIWELMTGAPPPKQIDHINGNRADNRWSNLRLVSIAENARNRKRQTNNTSGTSGVHKDKRTGRWRVTIGLGSYDTLEEAVRIRQEMEALIGYHQNHGRT